MQLSVVAMILLLFLFLLFGFQKVSANKNKEQSTNIDQLNIYLITINYYLFQIQIVFDIFNKNKKEKNPILDTEKSYNILIKFFQKKIQLRNNFNFGEINNMWLIKNYLTIFNL